MNNQNTLIKRKEYFGLVWLAAHRPTKISKIDIIKMDLSAKCKQLTEYINNGNARRPKFSLLVLSHLMYGLVVILNRKNTYLYNELVTLKGMLNVTYFTLYSKEKSKSTKKVRTVDRRSITMKDVIPEVFSECSLETMELDRELEMMKVNEVSFQQRYKKITLDDTDDIIERSTIIPLDYNYETDMLGYADDAGGMSFMFDLNEKNLLETTAMPQPKRPSLSQSKTANERTPFRDLTNNAASVQREAQPSHAGHFDFDTTLMHEGLTEIRKETTHSESALERLLTDEFNMPNLFQETVVQQETFIQPQPLEQIEEQQQQPQSPHEFREEIENLEFPDAPQRPLPKSISVELKDLKTNMSRKHAARETAKEKAIAKKSRLIVDTTTEIPNNELKNRMVPAFNTEQEMVTYFREKNTWLKTQNDYFLTDTQLFTAPFMQDARRTDLPMRDYEFFKRNSMRNQLVIKNKLLKTVGKRDDTYFYLTEARDREARKVYQEQTVLETAQPVLELKETETVQTEIQRKGKSLSREAQESNEIAKNRARNRSSVRGSYITDLVSNQADMPSVDQTLGMGMDMTLLPMAPLDLFADQTTVQAPITTEETVVAIDITNNQPDSDDYEKLILDALKGSEDAVILQDLINYSNLPSRCLQAQMPRKYFAAKLFFTSLKMCGQRQIKLNQEVYYDSIYMVEN